MNKTLYISLIVTFLIFTIFLGAVSAVLWKVRTAQVQEFKPTTCVVELLPKGQREIHRITGELK